MRTLGNILWHIPFLGFILAAITYLFGIILMVTVILAPIGKTYLELAKFYLAPFSSSMINEKDLNVDHGNAWSTLSGVLRVLYFPFGLLQAIFIIIDIALLTITIVGIPFAILLAKTLSTIFNPIGKVCVSRDVADEITRRKASVELDKALDSEMDAS